jgi:NitT/TauT family transport system substrate-binding protein
MMRALRFLFTFAVLVAAPLPLAAGPSTIRIGVINTDVSAEPVYAQAAGIFRANGISADIRTFTNGKQVLDGLESGTLDVGFANLVSAVAAIQQGRPLTVIAPGAIYTRTARPITVLVQAPASHFRSGRDLTGKTLGVPAPNDLGVVSTRAWIDATGGDSSTVHYVTGIPSAQIARALAAHRVDGAELSEPTLTADEQQGKVKPLASTFDALSAPFYIGVYVASKTWTAANPDLAHRFAIAMRDAARWANAHRAQTAPILAEALHVSATTTRTMVRARYGDVLSPGLIQPVIDLAAKYGVLQPMRATEAIEQR